MPEAMQRQLLGLAHAAISIEVLLVARKAGASPFKVFIDADGLAFERYDATDGTCYLAGPDQHVAARWREMEISRVVASVARATANFIED